MYDQWHRQARKVAYRMLVGKPERNMPLGRPRLIQKNNIKMVLQETVWVSAEG
jgi:hypothetical protein